MSAGLQKYKDAFRTGDKDTQFTAWVAMSQAMDRLYAQVGGQAFKFIDTVLPDASTGQSVASCAPSPAQFYVVGVDGKFIISIANPQNILPLSPAIAQARASAGINATSAPILHNLQSCSTVNFDAAGGLTDYGISPQLVQTYQNPNVTLFWRLRSSYDGKTWNQWQIGSSTATCGPEGVYSGLLRSVANSLLNNATMANGASSLTQSGTSTLIDVASSVVHAGSNSVLNYASGSVDPGSYGTWYVYALDPGRQGGTVTYIATQNLADLASSDGVIYFGSITTAMGGGGTGGGGIHCGVAGSLVDMSDGTKKPIEELLVGDKVKALDGGIETVVRTKMVANQPCFSIVTTGSDVLRGASGSHKLRRYGGGFARLYDLSVGDVILHRGMPAKIQGIDFIGNMVVFELTLDRSKTFLLDGFESHNMKMN